MKKGASKSRRKGVKSVSSGASENEKISGKNNGNGKFYIVGMGGSAGGLEAFGQFFAHMPADSGMAFVLIPHLDPTHKGMMPELVQRFTTMPVFQAEDGMKALPNCVYVIPPNKDMSILHGTLQLLEPSEPRGLRLPIDFFFRHLAEDRQERAVGVVLSGMGTDGTLGIKAIKEKLGMVMAQDVNSAKYDGMPRSAIATGLVDYVAPAEELPAKLLGYARHSSTTLKEKPPVEEKYTNAIQKITILLRDRTGHDFSFYKKNTMIRRIERRMSIHQINKVDVYVRYLRENSHEIELLFKELLIGVTSFFRDRESFEILKEKAIPELLKGKEKGNILRAWIPGCSTGEEAYSIAIILQECLEKLKKRGVCKIQIFATDIDKDAIDKARLGCYTPNIAADVSPERLEQFFTKEDNGYRVRKEIREMVVFAPQNIIMDPPFTKLDLISCRNILIYMTSELQKKLLPLLHYALNPGGLLFLGTAETVGSSNELFSPVDGKWRIFARKELPSAAMGADERPLLLFSRRDDKMLRNGKAGKGAEPDIPGVAQRILMENFTPPAVIINEQGDIVYISGRTGRYLEPAAGKTNMNIYAMAREGLRMELAGAVRKAKVQKTELTIKGLRIRTNGDYQDIDLTVKPFREPDVLCGLLMVVFEDVATPAKQAVPGKTKAIPAAKQSQTVKELQKELAYTKEHLQTTIEEMETQQEELKSANEELQSANEELQSANEELTTSREELQSINEELVTVNSGMHGKIEELSRANNDMQNLLNNVEIATIFLDNGLNVKRFTPQATKIINLIPTDIDRPVTHIVSNLKYECLVEDVEAVLHTLIFKESQVQTKDGWWHLMRILPYKTLDNIIDGVVITFTDITAMKQLEALLREKEAIMQEKLIACMQCSEAYARSVVDTVREPLLVLDAELRVFSASRQFYQTFQVTPEETEKRLLYELGNRQWDIPELRRLLEEILPKSTQFNDYRVEHDFPEIGRRVMLLNARRITREGVGTQMILLAIEDVTGCDKKV